MRGNAGRSELPADRPAAGDHSGCRVAVAILEADGEGGAGSRLAQRGTCRGDRPAGILFVADEDDAEIEGVQRADCRQRAQCVDHHHVAALHVGGARARPFGLAQPRELLKRTVELEDGIQVTNQQHCRPFPGALGDQVAGSAEGSSVDPFGREAESIELGSEQPADLAYSLEVHRAAVDVHRPLQQLEGRVVRRIDLARDALLRGRELGPDGSDEDRDENERDADLHPPTIERG